MSLHLVISCDGTMWGFGGSILRANGRRFVWGTELNPVTWCWYRSNGWFDFMKNRLFQRRPSLSWSDLNRIIHFFQTEEHPSCAQHTKKSSTTVFFLLMWSLNPKILEIFGGISTVVLCPREPRGQNDRPLRLVSCLEHPESCWESARVWFLGRPISSLWRNTFSTTLRTWLQPLLLKEKRSFIFFYSYVHGTEIQSHEVMH